MSGGLDSTTIAALVAEQHGATTGFCFGQPTGGASEGPIVARFAKAKGIDVDFIWPTSKAIVEAFWQTLDAQGAPFAGPSIVAQYLVFERVKQRGFKVLLGGQGGDEAFMGYRKFHLFRAQSSVRARDWSELVPAVTSLAYLMVTELPRTRENWRLRRRYAGGHHESSLALPQRHSAIRLSDGESLLRRQMSDITRHSLPTLLRYEDRNSMAHSVEEPAAFRRLSHR